MSRRAIILISIFFFACHSKSKEIQSPATVESIAPAKIDSGIQKQSPVKAPEVVYDTTTSDYLLYLLKNEKQPNKYWIERIDTMEGLFFNDDTLNNFSLTHDWTINDSVSVIILAYATGVSWNEFLITIKNKKEIVSTAHIRNESDSDPGPGNPDYYWSDYKLLNDRTIKVYYNKETDAVNENGPLDTISIETWTIHDNGKTIVKKIKKTL